MPCMRGWGARVPSPYCPSEEEGGGEKSVSYSNQGAACSKALIEKAWGVLFNLGIQEVEGRGKFEVAADKSLSRDRETIGVEKSHFGFG